MFLTSVGILFVAPGMHLNYAHKFPLLKYEAHEILEVGILLSKYAFASDQGMRVVFEFEKIHWCKEIQSLILSCEEHARVHYFPRRYFSPALDQFCKNETDERFEIVLNIGEFIL